MRRRRSGCARRALSSLEAFFCYRVGRQFSLTTFLELGPLDELRAATDSRDCQRDERPGDRFPDEDRDYLPGRARPPAADHAFGRL